jgi:hypothetical protein
VRFAFVAAVLVIAATSLLAHDPITTKITWEGEIKRLVEARCVSCHSAGGRAPMALTTYEEARPWARAIREEVLTRRMPKWHVVRGYGDFSNDPSLSPFEVALFAAWADGGAPKVLPPKPGATTPPTVVPTFRSGDTRDSRSGDMRASQSGPDTPLRSVDVPCSARSFPVGRLVGLRPALVKGGDLRVTVTAADGTKHPLLWLRGFDPAFAETYWLRKPLQVIRTTRVTMDGDAPCRVTALLAAQTAR